MNHRAKQISRWCSVDADTETPLSLLSLPLSPPPSPSFSKRRNYFVTGLLFSILHSDRPSFLKGKFKSRKDHVERDIRITTCNLCRLQLVEMYKKCAFRYFAVELWNNIFLELKSLDSFHRFKVSCFLSYYLVLLFMVFGFSAL